MTTMPTLDESRASNRYWSHSKLNSAEFVVAHHQNDPEVWKEDVIYQFIEISC